MAGTYYNQLDLDESISLLKGGDYKVGYEINSFNDTMYIVSGNGKVTYRTYSTAQLHAYCRGLTEGLKR